MLDTVEVDVLIVGGGAAGLFAAWKLGNKAKMLLLVKGSLSESNSFFAQGGIASAIAPTDTPESHIEDTLRAGRGLCEPEAVEVLTREGPSRIRELLALGTPFDTVGGDLDLGQEGGHSHRRIVHAGGSATGRAVVDTLRASIPPTSIIEHAALVELWASDGGCFGALVWEAPKQRWLLVSAKATILATGGACALFGRTTNPPGAIGEGIALAYRAGAQLADMEFVQFHPTALHRRDGSAFLISEAVRGEGAYLVDRQGERFLHAHCPDGELAPRDVVARAISQHLRQTGQEHVFLSLAHLDSEFVKRRFSNIYQTCLEEGIDIASDPIPVAPAAHYLMGGIVTDLSGATTVPGLYACGEVACTGVHGANRLASNSLLECLVFANRAAQAVLADRGAEGPTPPRPLPPNPPTAELSRANALALRWLGQRMMEGLGILRNEAGLLAFQGQLDQWEQTTPEAAIPQVRHALTQARLMAMAALLRTESRGAHFREDFPEEDISWQQHIFLRRGRDPEVGLWRYATVAQRT